MLTPHPASFRDQSGRVFDCDGRILRVISDAGAADYQAVRNAGIYDDLVEAGTLVPLKEIEPAQFGDELSWAAHVLEHPRLPFVSYPYEWSFSLLRAAALFHLDFHISLLRRGFTLSDASAYNVQFRGVTPVFIDHLSIRPYRDGEFWLGHRQFCEQFLNPLLLRSLFQIPHNAWFRGRLEGIAVEDLAKLLRIRDKFSLRLLTHVTLPSRFQRNAARQPAAASKLKSRRLPLNAYEGMLRQLRTWIAGLRPGGNTPSTWSDYECTHQYETAAYDKKKTIAAAFVSRVAPRTLIDLGCNTGVFSEVALTSGARRVIGFDFDHQALDKAFARARSASLDLLPLYLDARNPSPDQGWHQAERSGFATRANADAVMALAFIHHLAIAHNVPLEGVVRWITRIAPRGVIEFVPKSDPTVQTMLALRADIFPDYTEENFLSLLGAHARVERRDVVSDTGRTLIEFSVE